MKGTRRDVLSQIEGWSNDESDKRVFWLNGLAETGKSTIAQTFAEMSFADGRLGRASFVHATSATGVTFDQSSPPYHSSSLIDIRVFEMLYCQS
jgi:hypothetical protein